MSVQSQTPLLPDFLEDINASGQQQDRILLAPKQRKDYPGLLIKFFLTKKGVPVNGSVRQGHFDEAQGKTFIFESPFTLEQMIN